jgi:hypothetical protein
MNAAAGHGKPWMYFSRKCRCDDCRVAAGEYALALQIKRRDEGIEPPVHGVTANGYCNYRCRCDLCREAYTAWKRDYRARQKA